MGFVSFVWSGEVVLDVDLEVFRYFCERAVSGEVKEVVLRGKNSCKTVIIRDYREGCHFIHLKKRAFVRVLEDADNGYIVELEDPVEEAGKIEGKMRLSLVRDPAAYKKENSKPKPPFLKLEMKRYHPEFLVALFELLIL